MRPLKLHRRGTVLFTSRVSLLRWLYLGRMTVVGGILVGALVMWGEARLEQTFAATVMFLAALAVTLLSAWRTHLRGVEPGTPFLYGQVLFDAALVTGIVHITGAGASDLAPLYILVITAGAVLLPLPGGFVMGLACGVLYLGDVLWLHPDTLQGSVAVQVGLFLLVAGVTGWLGDRLRRAGLALGQVESALRELQLNTSDILGNISTGVLTVDGLGRLAYMNPAAEDLLGLPAPRWLGAPVLEAVEDVAPQLGALLRRSIREGIPLPRQTAVAYRGDGELVLGLSTTVLDADGEGAGGPPSVTAIFQDITDQALLEAAQRRNDRLEAVAELSASLAHEIKNPLASIRSAVEQLTRGTLGSDDRDVLERLVVNESERLSRLLSEFIEFSRMRLGQLGEVDLARLVHECAVLARQRPEARGVSVRERGVEAPLHVPGDAELLHRAVFNLVLNAVQFAGEGGEVVVELEDRSRELAPVGIPIPSPVRLRVGDSGPGIDPGDLPRIFDPFFTTREGGSGLGLPVVHRAVEAHKGAVFVERSELGGADFVVYLPGAVREPEAVGV